jgi:hypothetical protein
VDHLSGAANLRSNTTNARTRALGKW